MAVGILSGSNFSATGVATTFTLGNFPAGASLGLVSGNLVGAQTLSSIAIAGNTAGWVNSTTYGATIPGDDGGYLHQFLYLCPSPGSGSLTVTFSGNANGSLVCYGLTGVNLAQPFPSPWVQTTPTSPSTSYTSPAMTGIDNTGYFLAFMGAYGASANGYSDAAGWTTIQDAYETNCLIHTAYAAGSGSATYSGTNNSVRTGIMGVYVSSSPVYLPQVRRRRFFLPYFWST